MRDAVCIVSPLGNVHTTDSFETIGSPPKMSESAAKFAFDERRSVRFSFGPDILINPEDTSAHGHQHSVRYGSNSRRRRHRSPTPFESYNKSSRRKTGYPKLSDSELETTAKELRPCPRYPNTKSLEKEHGRNGRLVLSTNEMKLGPMLDHRPASKGVSFSKTGENGVESPTSIQCVPSARRIRRDLTPFSPRCGRLVIHDDDKNIDGQIVGSNSSDVIAQESEVVSENDTETAKMVMQQRLSLVMRIRERSAQKENLSSAKVASDDPATAVVPADEEMQNKVA